MPGQRADPVARHHRLIWRMARTYWRLVRPRTIGVRAVVLDPAGRIALVRHTYIDRWYLPGGGVDKREAVTTALARELREEIALDEVRVERVLGVYHNRGETKDDHVVVFVVRVDRAPRTLTIGDPREIAEAGWFALDALPDDLSPATARRIAEYRAGVVGGGDW